MIRTWPAVLVLIALTVGPAWADWAVQADIAEACSCNAACPCLFGSSPTHHACEGSRLMEIRRGHHGDVVLDGVTVLATFRMGEWLKIWVDDDATDEQAAAATRLITELMAWKLLSSAKAPIQVERGENTLRFAGPESEVQISRMEGRGGEPIRVQGLPARGTLDYIQYRSKVNRHTGEGKAFEYTGTNGFTSRMDERGDE